MPASLFFTAFAKIAGNQTYCNLTPFLIHFPYLPHTTMKYRSIALLALFSLTPAFLTESSIAQNRATSARDALALVASQYGPRSTQWIAEMRGIGGVPQPAEWDILSYDDRMPQLLYRFRAGMGRAGDMGPETQRYPVDVPVGYFNPNEIGVDSVAAFTIAEGEARKAKMAFDSCNYLLRVREFSTDPLWRLELLDARRQIVGKIYISGRSGAVMRTVWMYRDQGGSRIIDSSAPTGRTNVTGITETDFPEAPEPNGQTGIVQMRPPSPIPPGATTGIAGAPLPPVSGPFSRMPSGSIPAPPAPNQPYQPVSPGGSIADNTIPDPPAAAGPTAPPSKSGGQMRDLREDPPAAQRPDPSKPPIDIPSTSGGSSERIPPPPIPPGS